MLEHAVQMVLGGAKLIATNLDPNCPTQSGTRPGCGAIVSLIEVATGIKAFSVGKPSPVMMRTARKELGMATSETIMIGDTMETDILGGVQMGYRTILVLTGTHEARGSGQVRLPARHDRRFDRRPVRPGQAAARSAAHDEPRRRHAARHPRVDRGALVIQ